MVQPEALDAPHRIASPCPSRAATPLRHAASASLARRNDAQVCWARARYVVRASCCCCCLGRPPALPTIRGPWAIATHQKDAAISTQLRLGEGEGGVRGRAWWVCGWPCHRQAGQRCPSLRRSCLPTCLPAADAPLPCHPGVAPFPLRGDDGEPSAAAVTRFALP